MLHCADMPVARLLYTLLLVVALPGAALFLLWRSRRHPGYLKHWRERFLGVLAAADAAESTRPLVWIHAVSVGETRAALPLVEALLAQRPGLRILLTHGTPTGRQTGQELFGDRVTRGYLPYDLPWAVATFLDRHQPALGLLIETEVWPNLVAASVARGFPLCLVNARLSERSCRGYSRVSPLARPAFSGLARVLAQTDADARRLSRLGAIDVKVTGNLKSDADPDRRQVALGKAWRASWDAASLAGGSEPRSVWLAASTREGEDEAVLQAIRSAPDAAMLIWAPRHPHRVPQIERALDAAGIKHQRRSHGSQLDSQTRVWVGDTLGEMAAYIAAADAVFMGGSLVELGGQNLLEACAQAKPVLVGPHTFNFMDLTCEAVESGAAMRIADGEGLGITVGEILTSEERRTAMGAAALALRSRSRGSLAQTLADLADLVV